MIFESCFLQHTHIENKMAVFRPFLCVCVALACTLLSVAESRPSEEENSALTVELRKRQLLTATPDDIKNIQPKALFYNRENRKKPCTLTFDQSTVTGHTGECVGSGHLAGKKRTIYIVHGYRESGSTSLWMKEAKDALLDAEDSNVALIDWVGGSTKFYTKVVANTKPVSAWLAAVVKDAKQRVGGQAWCVGFSLGAHTCGQAGSRGHVDRITGLDPAGPLFENYNLDIRLKKENAKQVDVIHTDGNSVLGDLAVNAGTMIPLGHVDIYPNGGGMMPGCETVITTPATTLQDEKSILNLLGSFNIGCSHVRAPKYFIESVKSKKCSTKRKCTSQGDLPGSCGVTLGDKQYLGYLTDPKKPGIFYMEMNTDEPYCQG